MAKKVALITGITGQDGSYLAEFLLNKGYVVWGIKRRASLFNTQRIDHLFTRTRHQESDFKYAYTDLTDSTNLIRLIQEVQPDEIYNLAAQSHVKVSFDLPEYTANADGIGALRLLEAIRTLGIQDKTRFYQASTSELFGKVQETPQTEKTPFYPRSPYAVAKLFAYWTTVNYREAYNIFGCNGILFNHESPLRGETFVTRKITRAAAAIAMGLQGELYVGNLDASRDWGHAKDFIKATWLMLQQEKPDDYVIATGRSTTVRQFIKMSFEFIGIYLSFQGAGENEIGVIDSVDCDKFEKLTTKKPKHLAKGATIVKVDPFYFRPTEVDNLIGDYSKAKKALGWEPEYDLESVINEMMVSDIKLLQKDEYLNKGGFDFIPQIEDIL